MPIGKSLAKLPAGSGEPGEIGQMRKALDAQAPAGTAKEREGLRREALLQLLIDDPQAAADYLADYGISPEDFVAAILEMDEAEGLNFDVDENELSTSLENISKEGTPANQLAQAITPQSVLGVDPNTVTERPYTREARSKDDSIGAHLALPEAPPDPADDPDLYTMPPNGTVQGVEPPRLTTPPPSPTPTADAPETPAPKTVIPSLPPFVPGNTPQPAEAAPTGDVPHPPTDVEIGPDGVRTVAPDETSTHRPVTPVTPTGETPPAPAAPEQVSAAPQNAGTAEQSSQLTKVLNDALMGVSDVGNPTMPEVATPGAPPGAGGISQSDGARQLLLQRMQQGRPLSLGAALSLR